MSIFVQTMFSLLLHVKYYIIYNNKLAHKISIPIRKSGKYKQTSIVCCISNKFPTIIPIHDTSVEIKLGHRKGIILVQRVHIKNLNYTQLPKRISNIDVHAIIPVCQLYGYIHNIHVYVHSKV